MGRWGLALGLISLFVARETQADRPLQNPFAGGGSRITFEHHSEGNFGFFLVALPALVGTNLVAGLIGSRLRLSLQPRVAVAVGVATGAILGIAALVGLVAICGPPDDNPWSTRILALVFLITGTRTGWNSAGGGWQRTERPAAGADR